MACWKQGEEMAPRRFIAAAPDMLWALEATTSCHSVWRDADGVHPSPPTINAVYAAIAKARGG